MPYLFDLFGFSVALSFKGIGSQYILVGQDSALSGISKQVWAFPRRVKSVIWIDDLKGGRWEY